MDSMVLSFQTPVPPGLQFQAELAKGVLLKEQLDKDPTIKKWMPIWDKQKTFVILEIMIAMK